MQLSHVQCSEGMEVGAEFGGKFFYDPPTQCATSPRNLLLIAGGVGINPLISILRHFDDIYFRRNSMVTSSPKAVLLYSASTQAELLFKVWKKYTIRN
jgi:ferredoxin-NADP reductase